MKRKDLIKFNYFQNGNSRKEENRNVNRELEFYNLDAVIAVGYRVNSKKIKNCNLRRKVSTKKIN